MNFKILVLFFFVLLDEKITCSKSSKSCKEHDKLKCKRTFNTEMIQEMHECIDQTDLSLIKLECQIAKYKKHDSINVMLSFTPNSNQLNESATFNWFAIHNVDHRFNSNSHSYKKLVGISFNNFTNRSEANLIIKDIEENLEYKVCSYFGEFNSTPLCCKLKNHIEEEHSNLWMALLVTGVLVLIYLVISLVFWLCPPNEVKSIEELLASLPTKHVEALTKLVSNESISIPDEEVVIEELNRRKSLGFANPAYEADDTDIELKLYLEANKLRRLSRMSQHAAALNEDTKAIRQRVTFADLDTIKDQDGNFHMNLNAKEIEDFQAKIFKEKKRRDSVHPFKRTYDLTNIESDDSDE